VRAFGFEKRLSQNIEICDIPPRDPKGNAFRAARFDYGLRLSLKMTAEGILLSFKRNKTVGEGLAPPEKREKNNAAMRLHLISPMRDSFPSRGSPIK
jgi:hypothetical protein